jgi:hypothetical protein
MEDSPLHGSPASTAEPFYYLHNFTTVVDWVLAHHRDLLLPDEIERAECFRLLPLEARALLVRMIMRKGPLFRASRLRYDEIGPVDVAMAPLIAQGWIEVDGALDLKGLFAVLTKAELAALFTAELAARGKKSDWLEQLADKYDEYRPFSEWCTGSDDRLFTLCLLPFYDLLRLLFFGNLRQDWSEFVLADLGIYRYETVEFSTAARVFRTREDVDHYVQIHQCRELLEQQQSIDTLVGTLLELRIDNDWIAARREKLLFRIGQACERTGDLDRALAVYEACRYPGERARRVRVLERLQRFEDALSLCESALAAKAGEAEAQQLQRQLPRLRRCLGATAAPRARRKSHGRFDLLLPRPAGPHYVEDVVRQQLQCTTAPVYYVENTLVNSLFGLLCWDAIFAPIPGAFFKPIQQGPADLHSAGFQPARQKLFENLFAQLDSGEYRDTIRANYHAKHDLQSPFVYWSSLDEALLECALSCIPASHLRRLFERILLDIRANRSGLPDLIQFWPAEGRYRMIEVKGPGDRLQDNQVRWLEYCGVHDIPTAVCFVEWQQPTP